jgi:hypothetical protein
MRRAPALVVVVGVVAAVVGSAGRTHAADGVGGFWVTLAAGVAGAANPSDYSEFWFDSPHASPVAVTGFTGSRSVQATTAGGNTFFTAAGTPVVLPTTDGYAILTNREVANGSGGLPRFADVGQASGAPQTGGSIAGAHKLTVELGNLDNDPKVLSVGLTDENGNPLGSGQVTVPKGGWWVIGIGPGSGTSTDPNPEPSPGPEPTPDPEPNPVPNPDPDPNPGSGGGGSIATPEPTSLVLVGIGGLGAAGWRRLRRRK